MQTITRLEKLELEASIPILIPDEVLDKIKYLCKTINKVEWSGVLFYQVKGSIKNTSKMKITLKDVLLMDRGTKAHTQFDWDEDVVEYRMSNPESIEWMVGMIHSHNDMSVFFSGEDMSELNDNCTQFNYYLSLIVNNYMEMIAKIAFTGEPTKFLCKDEKGEDYAVDIAAGGPSIHPFMFTYSCDILAKQERIKVPDTFAQRLKIVEEKIKRKETERLKKEEGKKKKDNDKGGYYAPARQIPEKSSFPGWEKGANWETDRGKSDHHWMDDKLPKSVSFLAFMLRLGKTIDDDDDALEALDCIDMADMNMMQIFEIVSNSYDKFYEAFFKGKDGNVFKYKHYANVLEEVIMYLKLCRATYPQVDWLIDKLVQRGVEIEGIANAAEKEQKIGGNDGRKNTA